MSTGGGPTPLPELLVCLDGSPVLSAEEWRAKRRPELLELFRRHVYGRAPVGRPERLWFEVQEVDDGALGGLATRKLVFIGYAGPGGSDGLRLVVLVPNARAGPLPTLVLGSNRGPETIDETAPGNQFWSAREVIEAGLATAAFRFADIDPDVDDGFRDGVHGLFDALGPQPPDAQAGPARGGDAWGTIAAWAWGFSRVIDYLETDPDIDAARIGIIGHSRGGKTALWAAAQDERIAMAVSNESGSTGAAVARDKGGERIADITSRFPHWFCANYAAFAGREHQLPIDQHMLIALLAPRLAYVTSASEDAWADPASEWRGVIEAAPAWRLFGATGLPAGALPPAEQPLHAGRLAYHLRTGRHNLTLWDWQQVVAYAAKWLREAPG